MRVLVVEDEYKLRTMLVQALQKEGYDVDAAYDGDAALEKAGANAYELILLDWMLPNKDGVTVLKELRERGIGTTVIMVTVRDELKDRIQGLDAGADDYIVKPFHIPELFARIRAVTRRTDQQAETTRKVGNLEIDLMRHELKINGISENMTDRDFNLLELLTREPGHLYTRTQILKEVWQINFNPGTKVIDVYLNRLRKLFSEYPGSPVIENKRGVGYRIRL